jgi:hypothetical protein
MSYQIKNKLTLHQNKFGILHTTNEGLVKPQDFGMQPVYASSILMRGYSTHYSVDAASNLILKDLYVNVDMHDDLKLVDGKPPHIASKTNISTKTTFREYRNLNLLVEYSGFILVADEPISGLDTKYRLYGASYEEVFEVNVEKGKILSINDLSEKMQEHRTKYKDGDFQFDRKDVQYDEAIEKWVHKSIFES